MRLFEIYQEEPNSTFVHDGKTYNINKVFKLANHIKSELYQVSDLTWLLAYDTVEPSSYDHINTSIPVLITKWFDPSINAWRHVVIDGIHRLKKAQVNRSSHILGKMITSEMLNQCLIN